MKEPPPSCEEVEQTARIESSILPGLEEQKYATNIRVPVLFKFVVRPADKLKEETHDDHIRLSDRQCHQDVREEYEKQDRPAGRGVVRSDP